MEGGRCAHSCITGCMQTVAREMAQPVKARPGSKGSERALTLAKFLLGKRQLLQEMSDALPDKWGPPVAGCTSGPTSHCRTLRFSCSCPTGQSQGNAHQLQTCS